MTLFHRIPGNICRFLVVDYGPVDEKQYFKTPPTMVCFGSFRDFKFSRNPSDGIVCLLNYNGKEFKGTGKNKKIAKATCCVKLLQDNERKVA